MQRREWICRHLWPRGRDFSQECRFACIGVANQTCVGNRPQLEQEMSLLAFFTLRVLARRAIARALEMHIAFTSCSAPTKYKFFAVADKIDKRPDCRLLIADCGLFVLLARCVCVGRWALGVGRWGFLFVNRPDDCANWNLHNLVRARASRHLFSHSVPAVPCLNDRLVKKIREIINMPVRLQNHVAAASAISAVGPAFRHKFLPPKTDGAAPALSRLCKSFDPIDKHGLAALHR